MRHWGRSLFRTYLTVDARSLGLFRIAFGAVLLSDLIRRWVELRLWYTNSGLLPNHTLLWRPPARSMFSLFFTVSTPTEAQLGFMLCAIVYALFVIGYRTRWIQAFALIARVSLNSRLAVLENGGDMVMDLLVLLTLPLPLGARFSLDALLSSQTEHAALGKPSQAPGAAPEWRRSRCWRCCCNFLRSICSMLRARLARHGTTVARCIMRCTKTS